MTNTLVEDTRTQFPPFVGFPSIPRLFRDVIITEKIDGTNASVQVNEDGTVWAASRNRYITPESDNFGFAAWVKAHEEELKQLGAGRHFGEWYGAGIQRGYGLTEKRFALFNVSRWLSPVNAEWVDGFLIQKSKMLELPTVEGLTVVPIITCCTFDTQDISNAADGLRYGSRAVRGFMDPEGIVIFHEKAKLLFKYTLDGDGHKGTQ